jgi:hypothetical protein
MWFAVGLISAASKTGDLMATQILGPMRSTVGLVGARGLEPPNLTDVNCALWAIIDDV